MRILLDECVDPRCRQFFAARHSVRHVKDEGWLGLKNGELVTRANGRFDVLFTVDGNMRHQTSLAGLDLVVTFAEGHFRTLEAYEEPVKSFEVVCDQLVKGSYVRLEAPC